MLTATQRETRTEYRVIYKFAGRWIIWNSYEDSARAERVADGLRIEPAFMQVRVQPVEVCHA